MRRNSASDRQPVCVRIDAVHSARRGFCEDTYFQQYSLHFCFVTARTSEIPCCDDDSGMCSMLRTTYLLGLLIMQREQGSLQICFHIVQRKEVFIDTRATVQLTIKIDVHWALLSTESLNSNSRLVFYCF